MSSAGVILQEGEHRVAKFIFITKEERFLIVSFPDLKLL